MTFFAGMGNKKIAVVLAVLVFGFTGVYFFMPATLFGFLQRIERFLGGLQEKTIVVGNMTVHYLEGGRGEPLILIHGFGADKDNWTRIGKYLTPHFRIIAPDLPGFGETGKEPEGKYAIRDQAFFIRQFAGRLGMSSFHLGGNSMGGNIAGQYAALFPDTVKSLFLLAPGGVMTAEPSEMFRMVMNGEPSPLIAGSPEEFDALLAFVFDAVPFIPGPIKKCLTDKAIQNQALNTHIFSLITELKPGEPMESLLNGSGIKTLILWGKKDRVLHPGGGEILGRIMENSKTILLESIGHLPMIEAPEKTAAAYLEFLFPASPGRASITSSLVCPAVFVIKVETMNHII